MLAWNVAKFRCGNDKIKQVFNKIQGGWNISWEGFVELLHRRSRSSLIFVVSPCVCELDRGEMKGVQITNDGQHDGRQVEACWLKFPLLINSFPSSFTQPQVVIDEQETGTIQMVDGEYSTEKGIQ